MARVNGRPPKAVFLAVFVVFFFVSLMTLEVFGWVPYYVDGSTRPSDEVPLSSIPQLGTESYGYATPAGEHVAPERIIIPTIGKDLPILNPATKDNEALDALLVKGSVRYPDSALLGENGNMFIFAHSSHLAVVRNKMYQAFNDIEKLQPGDLITVRGAGKDYVYRVDSVRLTDANEEMIDLSPTREPKLTLSTCDNFGKKSSRYVVAASFLSAYATPGTEPSN